MVQAIVINGHCWDKAGGVVSKLTPSAAPLIVTDLSEGSLFMQESNGAV